MGRPFAPKIGPFHGGSGPHLIHTSLGLSKQSKWHFDQFSHFAGLTTVTDHRQTDHATQSVTVGRIPERSTAMQPNNNTDTMH